MDKSWCLLCGLVLLTCNLYAGTKDFLKQYDVPYKTYRQEGKAEHIQGVRIGGITLDVRVQQHEHQADIQATLVGAGRRGTLCVHTSDYKAFLTTLGAMIDVVRGSKTTDTLMYEEDREDADPVLLRGGGQPKMITQVSDTWTVNPARLLQMGWGLGLSQLTIDTLYIQDILAIEHLALTDIHRGLCHIEVRNAVYHNQTNKPIFRTQFEDCMLSINHLKIQGADIESIYYALFEHVYRTNSVTDRTKPWFVMYADNLANYANRAPITAHSIQAFDVAFRENNIAIRAYTQRPHGVLTRGQLITNKDIQFCIDVEVNPSTLVQQQLKELFAQGSIHAAITIKDSIDSLRGGMQSIEVQAQGLFDLRLAYARDEVISPRVTTTEIVLPTEVFMSPYNNYSAKGSRVYCTHWSVVQDKGLMLVNGAGDQANASRTVADERYRYVSVQYQDRGLNSVIKQSPKIYYDVRKIRYFMSSQTSAMVDEFLNNPLSLRFDIAADKPFNQQDLRWKTFMDDKTVHLNINGQEVE